MTIEINFFITEREETFALVVLPTLGNRHRDYNATFFMMRVALEVIIRNSHARDNSPSRNDHADSLAPSVEWDLSRWTFFSFALGPLARKEFRSRPSCAISRRRRRRRTLIVLCMRGVLRICVRTNYDDDDDGVRTEVYLLEALSTSSNLFPRTRREIRCRFNRWTSAYVSAGCSARFTFSLRDVFTFACGTIWTSHNFHPKNRCPHFQNDV